MTDINQTSDTQASDIPTNTNQHQASETTSMEATPTANITTSPNEEHTQTASKTLKKGKQPDHYLLDPDNTDSNGVWQQKGAVWNNKPGYMTVKFNDGKSYVMQSRTAREELQAIRKQKTEREASPNQVQTQSQALSI